MTIREFKVAQGLTTKPVKGKLTRPVTIINWSFKRVDVSLEVQAFQIGPCLGDEIADLEQEGRRGIARLQTKDPQLWLHLDQCHCPLKRKAQDHVAY